MFESEEMRPLTPLFPALIDKYYAPTLPQKSLVFNTMIRLVSVNKISIVHWGDFQELMEEKKTTNP